MIRSLFARAARSPKSTHCARRGLLTQAYSVGPTEVSSELSDDVIVETDVIIAAIAGEDCAAALCGGCEATWRP